jgi:fermentation-respiration switch protein FrsA (DUF1100 family)
MIHLKRLAILAVLLYLAAAGLVFALQRQLQYSPGRIAPAPEAVGLAGVQVVTLPTPDGETLILWYSPARPGKPTVLYFHGNAGEIGDRPKRFGYYQSQGFGVAYLSYRGFGGSTGSISETGLITDAVTAYDWLRAQNIDPGHIALVGESLGTGVAVQLAARHPVGAVALEAPYTATADVAARIYWWLPVRLLMRDQFRSIDHIAAVTAPLLVQHGDRDAVIPFEFGERLFAAATMPWKDFVTLPGLGHDALFAPETWAREAAFFAEVWRD